MTDRLVYSVGQLSKLFGLSDRRVQQLAKENVVVKAGRGKYDLLESVRGYVKYVNELIPNKQSTEAGAVIASIDADAERAKLLKHKARIAKQEADTNDGLLVNKEDEKRAAFKLGRNLRNNLMNLPNRISHELAVDTDVDSVYARLEKEIIESLIEVSKLKETEDEEACGFDLPVEIDADCSYRLWV